MITLNAVVGETASVVVRIVISAAGNTKSTGTSTVVTIKQDFLNTFRLHMLPESYACGSCGVLAVDDRSLHNKPN